jgi:kumamolisin
MNNFPHNALALIFCFSVAGLAQAQTTAVPVPGLAALGQGATLVGHHDPASVLDVDVVLKLRNITKLKSFLASLQDSASPEFHQFLTPQQFTDQYGPTEVQVSAVTDWLKSQGLTIAGVAPNRLTIRVKATTGALERVFDIRINDYQYSGRSVFSPAGKPHVPPAIAGEVTTILGLSDVVKPRPLSIPRPLSAAQSCGGVRLSYTPHQITTAYDWPSITDTNNGGGVTIANATAATIPGQGFSSQDITKFWTNEGLPSNHSITFITVAPAAGKTRGNGETTIDEEWAGAMAPGADLLIYVSQDSLLGFHNDYSQIVSDNQAQIVTHSWGALESDAATYGCGGSDTCLNADHALFMQAAAQGVTIVAASGDYGGDNIVWPSTDPYVTSAGGTRLLLNGDGTIKSETVWNNGCVAGGKCRTGGGVSSVFDEPFWQHGSGVPQNGHRNTGDLSLDADPCTGYDYYFQGSPKKYGGGTSFVAPELAGLFADFVSLDSGRLGAANKWIYADARDYYSSDFHDITQGSNGPYNAGPGWDHPTGWGTPDAVQLLGHLVNGVISPPRFLSAQFIRCVYYQTQMLLQGEKGEVGPTPSSYQVDDDIGTNDWQTIHNGRFITFSYSFPPFQGGMNVRLRARAWNGHAWSDYAYWRVYVPKCQGVGHS